MDEVNSIICMGLTREACDGMQAAAGECRRRANVALSSRGAALTSGMYVVRPSSATAMLNITDARQFRLFGIGSPEDEYEMAEHNSELSASGFVREERRHDWTQEIRLGRGYGYYKGMSLSDTVRVSSTSAPVFKRS